MTTARTGLPESTDSSSARHGVGDLGGLDRRRGHEQDDDRIDAVVGKKQRERCLVACRRRRPEHVHRIPEPGLGRQERGKCCARLVPE